VKVSWKIAVAMYACSCRAAILARRGQPPPQMTSMEHERVRCGRTSSIRRSAQHRASKARALLAFLLAAMAGAASAQHHEESDALWRSFLSPPAEARPMMRWWWFGPAVTHSELEREIRAMKAGGFGGFEVQPVYPLSLDAGSAEPRNLSYLSDTFIAALRHAAITARAEGMRIDVTGGSGWPFGGPHIPISRAAANIRMERVAVPQGATELMLPALGTGETLLAAMIGPTEQQPSAVLQLAALPIDRPRVTLTPSDDAREALIFVTGRTGQQVKRPAVGAEGFVLDHIDPEAVAIHLTTVGDRLLQAFAGESPPYAIFSDSLEAYGSSWTSDLPAEFRRRRGYDLLAHLPALFLDTPDSAAVRFDWARTLSELVDERYLAPINAWARSRGTRFRAQVYGFPPPTLSSNALVELPEGEGADWRSFTSTRWATSGAHLYAKPVVSSEVWTWLHSPSWAATPLDMKVEADRHFLQGVTQLIGHGWPYSPPGIPEPGWAFYAAAALNDHNPWYDVMPDVTRYLQRVTHMLRQGEPANSVAIYLPIEDAFAAMRPERASVNEAMHERVSDALVGQVLDAGHGFDFIDAKAILSRGLNYRVLVLPPMERIDADAYAAIAKWVKGGGKLIAIGALPRTAGGLLDAKQRASVQQLSKRQSRAQGVVVVAETGLRQALTQAAPPDVRFASPEPAIGFVRRRLASGDVYFIVNTSNTPVHTSARFAGDRGNGSWWDPMSGRKWSAGSGDIALDLAPYESRLLVFVGPPAKVSQVASSTTSRPLDREWTLSIADRGERPLAAFRSWTEDAELRYYSGTAMYRRILDIDVLPSGKCLALDFGSTSLRAVPPGSRLMAAVDAPIRDAAIVMINGTRAGALWAPPYRLDISAALRPGRNVIEVHVSNTAVNMLAGRSPPDYRLLNTRYGERFKPQDTDRIAPVPSGLLDTVTLIEAPQSERRCGG
jgi:hypothetical protein